MKVSGSYAIVMTPDRQFLRVPAHADMMIGQEIEIPKAKTRSKWAWRKFGVAAASFALALGLWQTSEFLRPERVSAYVALDINPSLELSIDKDREVLQAIPLNRDAEILLQNLKLKGKRIETAVDDVALEAVKLGYVKPESEILITASDAGESGLDLKTLEQEMMKTVQVSLQERGITSNVSGVLVTQKEREEAKSLGLTPGKYAVYKQAQASSIDIKLEDLKEQSVSVIASKHGEDVKEIVAAMKGDKQLEDLLHEISEKKSSLLSNRKDDEHGKNNNDKQNRPEYGDKNKNRYQGEPQNRETGKEQDKEKDKRDREKDKEKDKDNNKKDGKEMDDDEEHDNSRKNGQPQVPAVPKVVPSIPAVPSVKEPRVQNLPHSWWP